MKHFFIIGILTLLTAAGFTQTIPDLPIAIGVGSAEVWGDSIYHFGGSTSWGGGTRFATIYKYNGVSWQNYASMPDNDVWGISSTINGNTAYVYGGWPSGIRRLRIYNFVNNTWQSAPNSPNIQTVYGHTIEFVNGFVYVFLNGYVDKYNVATNTWTQAATLTQNGSWLHSTVYQNEVYLVGWELSRFYKYTPATDQWTQLADLPYFVTGSSLRCVDDKIYCVGGSSGQGGAGFNNTLVYDIGTNQWTDVGIFLTDDRAYMADVIYKNNFFVIGGLGVGANAVNTVELIVTGPSAVETIEGIPQEFQLTQNYPNPFNPSTRISFSIPNEEFVSLKVFNSLGQEVAELVSETITAGNYSVSFNAGGLTSGVYFYKIKAGSFTEIKKMMLIK